MLLIVVKLTQVYFPIHSFTCEIRSAHLKNFFSKSYRFIHSLKKKASAAEAGGGCKEFSNCRWPVSLGRHLAARAHLKRENAVGGGRVAPPGMMLTE